MSARTVWLIGSTAAAVGIATLLVSRALAFPGTGVDDANIFMVYARHLSAGEGFVFNPGGERVEGFSSMLWVLVGAAAAITSRPEQVLFAVNILLLTVSVAVCVASSVMRAGSADGASLPWAVAFVGLLLADRMFVAWNTVTLMETAIWTCVLTSLSVLALDGAHTSSRRAALAVLTVAVVLTRPEGLVWAPVFLILASITAHATHGRTAMRALWPAALAFVVTALGLTLFRLAYFGYPLPNTYYAKVSPSLLYRLNEGAGYLGGYVTSAPLPAITAAITVLSVAHVVRTRLRDTPTLTLSILSVAGLTIPVISGGDHFEGFRFYQATAPIFLLLVFHMIRAVAPAYLLVPSFVSRSSLNVAGISAAAVVVIATWTLHDPNALLEMEFAVARSGRAQGEALGRVFEGVSPLPAVGTITTGGIQYSYAGPVIDLMGLNNTAMAHNGGSREGYRSHAAFETRTFYELRPPIVIPLVQYSSMTWLVRRSHFVDQVLKGLVDDPRFRKTYALAELRRHTVHGPVVVAGWFDRGLLTQLAQSNLVEVHVPVPAPHDPRAITLVRLQPSPQGS